MQLFFADDIESIIYGLSPEESKHCVKVLRMSDGDEIYLTDGKGALAKGRITIADPKGCVVEIVERIRNYGKRPQRLHIAVAPTKNADRIEWFVEKAVEMGIEEITPVVCDHSERKTLNMERLEKIVVSAMKQSLKTYRPILNPPTPVRELIAHADENHKYICHCEGDLREGLKSSYKKGDSAVVLIGPEGDFSQDEIATALRQGFRPITLGDCRLRTETAALYALTALNFMNE